MQISKVSLRRLQCSIYGIARGVLANEIVNISDSGRFLKYPSPVDHIEAYHKKRTDRIASICVIILPSPSCCLMERML